MGKKQELSQDGGAKNEQDRNAGQASCKMDSNDVSLIEKLQSLDQSTRNEARDQIANDFETAVRVVGILQEAAYSDNVTPSEMPRVILGLVVAAPREVLAATLLDIKRSSHSDDLDEILGLVLTNEGVIKEDRIGLAEIVAERIREQAQFTEEGVKELETATRLGSQTILKRAFHDELPTLLEKYHGWYAAFALDGNNKPVLFGIDDDIVRLREKCYDAKLPDGRYRIDCVLSQEEMDELFTEII